MTRLMIAALAALTAASPALANQPHDAAFGLWLVESKKAIVEIAPCGDKACGKIVWLAEPTNSDGSAKLDRNNEDAGLRARPICGMAMIGDFRKASDNRWDEGFIYNPEEGDTYKSNMHVRDNGELYVRGYVGISLLGKSQIWTRVSDNRGGC